MGQWIDTVNQELNEETDPEKHNKLAEQYRKLTHEKEMMIQKEYNSHIKEVDDEITALIIKVAKQNGCNAVFVSTSMVSGGKDITEDVIKKMK